MNKNKQVLFGVIAVVIVLCVVVALVIHRGGEEKDQDVIKIGAILPLTGNLSFLGEEERNALSLVNEDMARIEGYPKMQIVFADSMGTARDGLSAYHHPDIRNTRHLITSLTIVSESVNAAAADNVDVQLALSVHPEITARPKVVRPYYGLEQEIDLAVQLFRKLGAERVAALHINTPEAADAVAEYLVPLLEKNNIEFLGAETYTFADTSLRNILEKIRSQDPCFIYTHDFGNMYPIMLREAEVMGIRTRILGGLGLLTAPNLPNELKKELYFVSPTFAIAPTEQYLNFIERYQERFSSKPTFDGVYTYDAGMLLAKHISRGTATVSGIANSTYEGISGKMKFDDRARVQLDISAARYNANGVPEILISTDF